MQNETLGDEEVLFREVQRVRQPWIAGSVLVLAVGAAGSFAWGMVRQLAFGRPFGDQPMPDPVLAIVGTLVILLSVAAAGLVLSTRLIVEVRADGVWVRFFPLHLRPRRIRTSLIERAEPVAFRPRRDYGGWGVRMVRTGRAYTVRGTRGVRLDLSSGRHVLVGSQRADALAEAVQRARTAPTSPSSARSSPESPG